MLCRCFSLPATFTITDMTTSPNPILLCTNGDLIRIGSNTYIYVQKLEKDKVFLYVQTHPHERIEHLDVGELELFENALKNIVRHRRRVDEL